MFFRFRKRDGSAPSSPEAAPSLTNDTPEPGQETDWVPEPDAAAGSATPPPGVELGQNPHKGKALESARGSHR